MVGRIREVQSNASLLADAITGDIFLSSSSGRILFGSESNSTSVFRVSSNGVQTESLVSSNIFVPQALTASTVSVNNNLMVAGNTALSNVNMSNASILGSVTIASNLLISGKATFDELEVTGSVTLSNIAQATTTEAGIVRLTNSTMNSNTNVAPSAVVTYELEQTKFNKTGGVITGGVEVHGGVTASNFFSVSDERLKTNMTKITDAITKISNLQGYTFDFNGNRRAGLIAQNVRDVIPEAVYEVNGYLHVSYDAVLALLLEAVKDLKAAITTD